MRDRLKKRRNAEELSIAAADIAPDDDPVQVKNARKRR